MTLSRRIGVTIAIAVLLATILAGQASSDALAPVGRAPSGRSIGRASFAFLGGLRTFAAAVMWNRLEPQYHEYFSNLPFDQQLFVLPTVKIVTMLDPQSEQPYFVASLLLARSGHEAEGMQLAQDGVTANPQSGLLLSSLTQMIVIYGKDYRAAATEADHLFAPGVRWATLNDEYEGLAIARDAYKLAGETTKYDGVIALMKQVGAKIDMSKPVTPTEHIPNIDYSR
jgi:hypothetical protein